jgi:hypothetical protein
VIKRDGPDIHGETVGYDAPIDDHHCGHSHNSGCQHGIVVQAELTESRFEDFEEEAQERTGGRDDSDNDIGDANGVRVVTNRDVA